MYVSKNIKRQAALRSKEEKEKRDTNKTRVFIVEISFHLTSSYPRIDLQSFSRRITVNHSPSSTHPFISYATILLILNHHRKTYFRDLFPPSLTHTETSSSINTNLRRTSRKSNPRFLQSTVLIIIITAAKHHINTIILQSSSSPVPSSHEFIHRHHRLLTPFAAHHRSHRKLQLDAATSPLFGNLRLLFRLCLFELNCYDVLRTL
ncbi:unnamed protein product [Vicia faba]|uniref:Uncharacterized protein n=1 Tax=Vicia faba TaxID=3906 RepID=A0AAV0YXN9_VICFA|nr:unnamed protein product [Vicia faba]